MVESYKDRSFMITRDQIKQIHTLKNLIGLEDDLYRDMLASFGVYSSKSLTETEARVFISILNDNAKKLINRGYKKYDDFNGRNPIMATPLQLRKLEATWADICNSDDKKEQKESLRKYIKKQFRVDDIRFMTKNKASRVIAILEQIRIKKYLKAL